MNYVKKHFKICVLFLGVISICFSCSLRGYCSGIRNAWDTYYNWLVDLNYRKYEFVQQRIKMQYKNVRNFLDIATKIFTGEPLNQEGSHGGDGHSRDTAIVYNEEPVATPQPIYKNYDNSVYNPVTNNYEEISYYYEDNSSADVYSFETTNNFITYEYNYTYYDIVVSPKDSPTQGKFFKVYYELPDGRSSFNLTPDDIDGVIFNYDVVNYVRTVTDEDVLGIWHLDDDYINVVDNTLTYNHNQEFVDGRFGGCIALMPNILSRSSGGHFSLRLYDLNSLPQNWTLEFWIYIPDISSTIFQYGNEMFESVPQNETVLNPSGWHAVAITSDGYMYVDGQYDGSISFSNDYLFETTEPELLPDTAIHFYQTSGGWVYLDFRANYKVFDTRIVNGTTINQVRYGQYYIDEIKLTSRVLYEAYDSYVPRYEPYDLNFAYTVPDLDIDYSTIAIQSPVNVLNTQIGGVRSSEPSVGDVFISLYDGRATSVSQYYNGNWNSVNGAVYLNGRWEDLLQYNFNTLMLEPDEDSNTGATFIYNVYNGDSFNYVDISGDDITFTIDTSAAKTGDVTKLLLGIPILFGFVGTVLGALCPFLPSWLTGLIALGLGCVVTLILFVFIRRK